MDEPLKKALIGTLEGLCVRIPDNDGEDGETSYKNLRWMVQTCLDEIHTMPLDKVSRWVGFIQGVLATKGLLSVSEERDRTRPLFHEAYAAMGLGKPESREAP
jgi:hypothetical protein